MIYETRFMQPAPFVDQAISRIRWITLALMLLVTLFWPAVGRTGHSVALYIVAFACYNGLIELLRWRVPRLRSYAWVPIVDLPLSSLFYYLDYDPGGPFFVVFYLGLLSAAATMPLLGTVLYTLVVGTIVALVAPTLPGWSPTPMQLRQLSARLVVFALVGIGTAVVLRRLMREQAAAQAAQRLATQLAEMDRLRDEFLASISHDLRTPLTAAQASLGMFETAVGDQLAPVARPMLTNARRNIGRLGVLIDDLLTYNQVQAGVLQLDCEPLDLREVVTDALGTIAPLLQQKGQSVALDLPAPLPVDGDARRLGQVVVNLLANAHYHTPPGTHIKLRGWCNTSEVRLAVQDNGPGVPADERESIFQRFHRAQSGASGSGLGLAITRAIVELHHGRVWLQPTPAPGATFIIGLPRHQHELMGEAEAER
jgi:signal transduction histidine kinase